MSKSRCTYPFFHDFEKGVVQYKGSNNIQHHVHNNNVSKERHRHDYFEFYYVTKEACTMIINGDKIRVEKDHLILMNPYVYLEFEKVESITNLDCFQFNYEIGHRLLNSTKNTDLIYEFVFLSLSKHHMITNYIIFDCSSAAIENTIVMLKESLSHGVFNEDLSYAHLNTLFVYLDKVSTVVTNTTKINNRLENILNQYFDENLPNANLKEFSILINYSYEQASILIKETTGCTFSELLFKKKLSQVRNLLLKTAMNVGEICSLTNIGNRSYFNQKFKKETGYSMADFRKRTNRQ